MPLLVPVPPIAKDSLLARSGNTPLVELHTLFRSDKIRILAKLEWFNLGGSVKDRPAYNMIRRGEETGELHPGKTIVDSTSGNTGIAYAFIAAAKGYRTLLAMPKNAIAQRKKILRAYGAELLLTDPLEGSDGSIRVIRELYEKFPDQYFYPDQYGNDANWQAHYHSTVPEIYSESHQEVNHFVAGLETSGTFMGTSRRLKELDPRIQAISLYARLSFSRTGGAQAYADSPGAPNL
jgi:cysteine synthase B